MLCQPGQKAHLTLLALPQRQPSGLAPGHQLIPRSQSGPQAINSFPGVNQGFPPRDVTPMSLPPLSAWAFRHGTFHPRRRRAFLPWDFPPTSSPPFLALPLGRHPFLALPLGQPPFKAKDSGICWSFCYLGLLLDKFAWHSGQRYHNFWL